MSPLGEPRVIGVDFDNTIADYDALMHAIAVERGLIPVDTPKNKRIIRDVLRALPDGESHWRGVQVTAYGPRMHEARLIDGVVEFFSECRRRQIPIYIVSHKTPYANFGAQDVNLREAATAWLTAHGFFSDDAIGLRASDVYFEATRAEKIARVKSLGVTHFVDDLEETFLEKDFPATTQKLLLAADAQTAAGTGAVRYSTWRHIHEHLFGAGRLAVLTALVGRPVQSVDRIGRGGNSKVYRITCDDGTRFAAKFYFQRTMDGLDRLEVEFTSLRFLWDNGERRVPEPLAVDRDNQIAVYAFVEGTDIDSRHVSEADIDQLVSFADRLRHLAPTPAAATLPVAAEACFSFDALYRNILGRTARLQALDSQDPTHLELREFLSDEFIPSLATAVDRIKSRVGTAGWTDVLPPRSRTLSPSDFGFHNALRRADGSIVLLDLEYFGSDDPAKLIADFVLHPAMNLSESIKRYYVERMRDVFADDAGLPARLAAIYPLFGLKWCTILLNEFVPRFLERREFATATGATSDQIRRRQLAKARAMLGNVTSALDRFPYAAAA